MYPTGTDTQKLNWCNPIIPVPPADSTRRQDGPSCSAVAGRSKRRLQDLIPRRRGVRGVDNAAVKWEPADGRSVGTLDTGLDVFLGCGRVPASGCRKDTPCSSMTCVVICSRCWVGFWVGSVTKIFRGRVSVKLSYPVVFRSSLSSKNLSLAVCPPVTNFFSVDLGPWVNELTPSPL